MSMIDKVNSNRTRQTKDKEQPFPVVATPQTSPNEEASEVVEKSTRPDVNKYFKKPQEPKKQQVSVYLDPKVIKALNAFGKANGKGAKSDLINNFLIDLFEIE